MQSSVAFKIIIIIIIAIAIIAMILFLPGSNMLQYVRRGMDRVDHVDV
jgi:hypothetical protein